MALNIIRMMMMMMMMDRYDPMRLQRPIRWPNKLKRLKNNKNKTMATTTHIPSQRGTSVTSSNVSHRSILLHPFS